MDWLRALVAATALVWFAADISRAEPQADPSHPNATEMLQLVDKQREGAGLPPFNVDPRLVDAAEYHNQWMAENGCYEHDCPGEPDLDARLQARGYNYGGAGENIFRELLTAESVLAQWLDSPIHYGNLLLRGYVDIGCAYLEAPGGPWWTCVIARPL